MRFQLSGIRGNNTSISRFKPEVTKGEVMVFSAEEPLETSWWTVSAFYCTSYKFYRLRKGRAGGCPLAVSPPTNCLEGMSISLDFLVKSEVKLYLYSSRPLVMSRSWSTCWAGSCVWGHGQVSSKLCPPGSRQGSRGNCPHSPLNNTLLHLPPPTFFFCCCFWFVFQSVSLAKDF